MGEEARRGRRQGVVPGALDERRERARDPVEVGLLAAERQVRGEQPAGGRDAFGGEPGLGGLGELCGARELDERRGALPDGRHAGSGDARDLRFDEAAHVIGARGVGGVRLAPRGDRGQRQEDQEGEGAGHARLVQEFGGGRTSDGYRRPIAPGRAQGSVI